MDYMTHPFLRCSIPCYDYVGTIDCDVSLNRQVFIQCSHRISMCRNFYKRLIKLASKIFSVISGQSFIVLYLY